MVEMPGEIASLLSQNKLVLAVRAAQRLKIDIQSYPELKSTIQRIYDSGRYQEILMAYKFGMIGPYSKGELLRKLVQKRNDSAVVKYAGMADSDELRREVKESIANRIDHFVKKGSLVKAARVCRKSGFPLSQFPSILVLARSYYAKSKFKMILSTIYEAGEFGDFQVIDLLKKLAATKQRAAFLANAYRFGIRDEILKEIGEAIQWRRIHGIKDADAWEKKFERLELIPTSPVEIERSAATRNITRLRLVNLTVNSKKVDTDEEEKSDPYIISQTAKVKLERANNEHKRTQKVLEDFLHENGFRLSNSKLIDLMSEIGGKVSIYEVKSINQENERSQVRHAVSQLFEYRFLHKMPNADLYIVFSTELFSGWLIEYLRNLGIGVLWVTNGEIAGPDQDKLLSLELL